MQHTKAQARLKQQPGSNSHSVPVRMPFNQEPGTLYLMLLMMALSMVISTNHTCFYAQFVLRQALNRMHGLAAC